MKRASIAVACIVVAGLLAGCGVKAPTLAGMTELEAQSALESRGLRVEGLDYDPTSREATWTVIRQSVEANTRAKEGSGVRLVLAGSPPATVPDLLGLDEAAASHAVDAAHFLVGAVASSYDESAQAGVVCTQSPSAGLTVPQGTRVAFVISKGRAPVEVPRVVGTSLKKAKAKLAAAGFETKTRIKHDSAKKGTVLSQKPLGGKAPPGSTVTLSVSDGVPPRPSVAEVVAAMKRLYVIPGASAQSVRMTLDGRNRWWASGVMRGGPDPAVIYIFREGGRWKMYTYGTEVMRADLPSGAEAIFNSQFGY